VTAVQPAGPDDVFTRSSKCELLRWDQYGRERVNAQVAPPPPPIAYSPVDTFTATAGLFLFREQIADRRQTFSLFNHGNTTSAWTMTGSPARISTAETSGTVARILRWAVPSSPQERE